MRPIPLRRLLGGLSASLLLAGAALVGLVWLSLPQRAARTTRIEGLGAAVDITLDADGVPRIRAASDEDAATALGFLHARERMFQMDLMRRAASGRLSEIAGPATLPLDRMMRVLGLRRRAVADLAGLPAPTVAMLTAYARGVNAWIAARGRFAATEFLPFGAPEPWTPVDSLLWGKTMELWLSANYRTELARLAARAHLDPARILALWPGQDATPAPQAARSPAGAATFLAAVLPAFPDAFTQAPTASNEWAVDGSHTATGAPLLAGDPHLAFGFPSVWYLARIDTPGTTLAGATAPGIPFLVLGHNGHIAWTFTTNSADTEDVFEEQALPDGRYAAPDGPHSFQVYEERIRVRGAPDELLYVRETRHGPVISDLDPAPGHPVLAVQIAALQPGDTAAAGLLALNRARDIAAAGAAAPAISAPVQNLLVADRAGIAQFTTGRVPIRRSGDGAFPVPGSDGTCDWIGWASGLDLPHVVNPPGGRIVNGNERTAPPDFPVHLGRDWYGDWRAQRMRELLGRSDRLTVADFTAMQADTTSTFARALLPVLRAVRLPPPAGGPASTGPARGATAARALALLTGWNGEMEDDLPQPLVFNAWVQRFYQLVLARADAPEALAPWLEFSAYVLSPQGAAWCGGDCAGLLGRALDESVATLSARFGADPAAWRWGVAHQALFDHPLIARLPLIGRLGRIRVAAPGDDSTLFRSGNRAGALEAMHGAEYRGVYDLADLDRSRFLVAPGQSGSLFSSQAHDMLTRWREGGTIALAPLADRVRETMRLLP